MECSVAGDNAVGKDKSALKTGDNHFLEWHQPGLGELTLTLLQQAISSQLVRCFDELIKKHLGTEYG